MSTKFNAPDSDQSARKSHHPKEDLDAAEATPDLQTSHKSGKHSTAEKLAASRPEFADGRGAQPVDGAFGHDTEEPHPTGRNASPGTDQFHCDTCGRYFNTEPDLRAHETECRAAKAATAGGRESIS